MKLSAAELYAEAQEAFAAQRYETAIRRLEKLHSRFPYGRYAQQAQMEIAYAYYKQGEPAPALSAIDRFIKQYPNNRRLDYVLYLKGLIHFDETLESPGVKYFGQNAAERDPQSLRDAFDAFKELVTRFPGSRYTPDARLRLQFLANTLAASDIAAARYYQRRGAHIAAINRAQNVLTSHPTAPQTRDALDILIQSYDALGLNDLRDDARRILEFNIARDGVRPAPVTTAPWWQFWNG